MSMEVDNSTATAPPPPAPTVPSSDGAAPANTAVQESQNVQTHDAATGNEASVATTPIAPQSVDGGEVGSEQSTAEEAVRDMAQSWVQDLAGNDRDFQFAMTNIFGEQYNEDAFGELRKQLASGEAEWMPEVRVSTDPEATEVTLEEGVLEVPASMLEQPAAAARAIAQAMAPVLAQAAGLDPAAAANADGKLLGRVLDPAEHTDLAIYLTQPPANESQPHEVLAAMGLEYGSESLPHGHVATDNITHDYVAGWLGTPPEVGQMDEGGIGNLLNKEWQMVVADAAQRNGGLGNSEDGFLAFSKTYGFVRLRNPRLSPEQNRRLAEMSLMMGVPVETIPSRTADSSLKQANVDKWVNEIIGRYDKEWADFKANPKDEMSVSDGRKRYIMKLDQESGRVISYDFKKSGGFKGFLQKNMKYIGPVLDVISVAANVIPGIGQVASFAIGLGSQALKTAGSAIATGKLYASQVAGLIGSAIPGIMKFGGFGALSATQDAALKGTLNAAGNYIDTGEFDAGTLAGAVAPSIFSGLPGGALVDKAVQNGVVLVAEAIQDGKIDANAALGVVTSLVDFASQDGAGARLTPGAKAAAAPSFTDSVRATVADALDLGIDTVKTIETVAGHVIKAIGDGELSGKDIANSLAPLLGYVSDDPATQGYLKQTLNIVARAVDEKTVKAGEVARFVLPILFSAMESDRQQVKMAA